MKSIEPEIEPLKGGVFRGYVSNVNGDVDFFHEGDDFHEGDELPKDNGELFQIMDMVFGARIQDDLLCKLGHYVETVKDSMRAKCGELYPRFY